MSRRHFVFESGGIQLAGSLDFGPSATGLLIVSGGNELRSGPWGSQALLAQRIAATGFPIMRFDRSGIGDSEGRNAGFAGSADDIAAALRAFRAQVPALQRIVAFGNCDAASALMLTGGKGCDGLVLANPWTFETEAEPRAEAGPARAAPAAPPSVLRAHYLRRLSNPAALWRLITGKVMLSELAGSLTEAVQPGGGPTALARRMDQGLSRFAGPATILIAERDRTAQAFLANWRKEDTRLRRCAEASHSFVEPQAWIWLQEQLLAALRGV